jgi:hypothetical protein
MTDNNDAFAELATRRRKLEELRREIQIGLHESARGEVGPWDVEEIKREGREMLRRQLKDDRSN